MSTQGELSPNEIDIVLRECVIGRIGWMKEGKMHITPVAYAYDGHFISCYSADGEKLRAMRLHPSICFEVDMIENFSNWRSVAAWGIFEAMEGPPAMEALEHLSERMRTAAEADGGTGDPRTFVTRAGQCGVMYRIRILELSGRFERSASSQ